MTETATGGLIAFLNARLGEERAKADPGVCGCYDANHVPSCVPTPARDRRLREIEALYVIANDCVAKLAYPANKPMYNLALRILGNLAAIWSDHADYRPEWKPADLPGAGSA